ncbi:solute carrier family 17 [Anaeramoeba flamelloides]|uniref:Solute carrier family 17 n=1 Tax=Anaeramoeba flamelloides TaxID=1746091 RepID=A0ABQ8YGX7_9EUKA|nr:solute carrier family 17 [Anaeramoeba flamelloides]
MLAEIGNRALEAFENESSSSTMSEFSEGKKQKVIRYQIEPELIINKTRFPKHHFIHIYLENEHLPALLPTRFSPLWFFGTLFTLLVQGILLICFIGKLKVMNVAVVSIFWAIIVILLFYSRHLYHKSIQKIKYQDKIYVFDQPTKCIVSLQLGGLVYGVLISVIFFSIYQVSETLNHTDLLGGNTLLGTVGLSSIVFFCWHLVLRPVDPIDPFRRISETEITKICIDTLDACDLFETCFYISKFPGWLRDWGISVLITIWIISVTYRLLALFAAHLPFDSKIRKLFGSYQQKKHKSKKNNAEDLLLNLQLPNLHEKLLESQDLSSDLISNYESDSDSDSGSGSGSGSGKSSESEKGKRPKSKKKKKKKINVNKNSQSSGIGIGSGEDLENEQENRIKMQILNNKPLMDVAANLVLKKRVFTSIVYIKFSHKVSFLAELLAMIFRVYLLGIDQSSEQALLLLKNLFGAIGALRTFTFVSQSEKKIKKLTIKLNCFKKINFRIFPKLDQFQKSLLYYFLFIITMIVSTILIDLFIINNYWSSFMIYTIITTILALYVGSKYLIKARRLFQSIKSEDDLKKLIQTTKLLITYVPNFLLIAISFTRIPTLYLNTSSLEEVPESSFWDYENLINVLQVIMVPIYFVYLAIPHLMLSLHKKHIQILGQWEPGQVFNSVDIKINEEGRVIRRDQSIYFLINAISSETSMDILSAISFFKIPQERLSPSMKYTLMTWTILEFMVHGYSFYTSSSMFNPYLGESLLNRCKELLFRVMPETGSLITRIYIWHRYRILNPVFFMKNLFRILHFYSLLGPLIRSLGVWAFSSNGKFVAALYRSIFPEYSNHKRNQNDKYWLKKRNMNILHKKKRKKRFFCC